MSRSTTSILLALAGGFQVMYWEPAKYVAKLRTLKADSNPLVFKTKMQPAGHGGASGRYDALKDRAFEVAWMLKQVGITK